MITLEKLLTELKAESLNEIVAGGHCGGGGKNKKGKSSKSAKSMKSPKSAKSNKSYSSGWCCYCSC